MDFQSRCGGRVSLAAARQIGNGHYRLATTNRFDRRTMSLRECKPLHAARAGKQASAVMQLRNIMTRFVMFATAETRSIVDSIQ